MEIPQDEIIHLEEGLGMVRRDGTNRYQKIAGNDFKESFSAKDFMELSTTVYKMCTQSAPHVYTEQLYEEYGKAVETYVKDVVLARLTGKRDEFLLQTLHKEFTNFKVYVRMIKNVFNYLNRFYVQRRAVPKLESVGTIKFDEGIFNQAAGIEIRKAALLIIHKDREGESTDRDLIKNITTTYTELNNETNANETDKYETGFEVFFLEESNSFYSTKAATWLQDSLPEYLIKVEKVIEGEKKLAESCLPPGTLPKLEQVLNKQLLENHQKTLLERETGGFSSLLMDMRKADLKRMYDLFSRIENGLKPLARQFCSFVEKRGQELVETFDVEKVSSPASVVEFVKKLIDMHDAYTGLHQECFSKSPDFNTALKEAFQAFLNRNMGPAGNKDARIVTCAELLSTHCDTLLKASGEKMSDDQLEATLEKVVQLFNHLSDKDMFNEFYRKQLARRLLQRKSASDDAELRMLEMLKTQCGNQFTSKLEGMVKDLTMSKESQSQFASHLQSLEGDKKIKLDFEVQVLTTGYWPSSMASPIQLILPPELVRCIDTFKEYYESTTKHRKLRWLHSMGQVTLAAKYNKKYDITVSTPQACILMLFNGEDTNSVSFDEVRTHLGIEVEEAEMKRQLLTLSAGKFKLLKKDPPGKTINPSDKFTINDKFKSEKRKIKVPTISSKEMQNSDNAATKAAVTEDRKHAIEAAIVRIMKARKKLEFQKLVLETSQQLIRLFKPDIKLIKARMEDLISREYLERDPDNSKLLRYLA